MSQSEECRRLSYTLSEWEAEVQALIAGGDPPPCPCCGRRGCYEPKFASPDRRYRACKFCGFWQNVGERPMQVNRYECRAPDHSVADWKVPTESWTCPGCGSTYRPEQSVAWPADDPAHEWNEVPTAGTQEALRRFWSERGMKVGPFGIP